MAGRQSSFTWKSGTIFKNIKGLDERGNKAVAAAFEYQGTRSEAYMRTNAKWTDQTGNARSNLFTAVKHEGTTHSMVLSHGVPYGIWLEIRFAGRYSIVLPAWLAATVELKMLLSKLFANLPKGG
jgi:hypothetical protein